MSSRDSLQFQSDTVSLVLRANSGSVLVSRNAIDKKVETAMHEIVDGLTTDSTAIKICGCLNSWLETWKNPLFAN
jgi:hypothetical protein